MNKRKQDRPNSETLLRDIRFDVNKYRNMFLVYKNLESFSNFPNL